MSDQFIREIEEDLRRDRLKKLWDRYGMVLIAGAAAIVIGTAGLVFWGNYSERRAAEAGDTFIAAIEASRVGDNAEATRLLNNLIESGGGSYRPLARLRSAALLAEEGDVAAAVAAFDAFEAESNDLLLSDLARIRAAMLLVDTAPHAEIKQRIEDFRARKVPGGIPPVSFWAFRLTAQENMVRRAAGSMRCWAIPRRHRMCGAGPICSFH